MHQTMIDGRQARLRETRSSGIHYVTIGAASDEAPENDTALIAGLARGLVVVWRQGAPPSRARADRIVVAESDDDGCTWRRQRTAVTAAPEATSLRGPALCALPSGELLLGCLSWHEDRTTSWSLYRAAGVSAPFVYERDVWARAPEQWRQGSVPQLLRLRSGRLVVPIQGGGGYHSDRPEVVRALCLLSDDEGMTWRPSESELRLPLRGALEPSLTELRDEMLLMSLRTQLGSVFLSFSSDGGVHWSLPQTAGLGAPESGSCVRAVPGTDRVAIVWNAGLYDPSARHFGPRTPLSLALSADRGASWRKLLDLAGGPVELTSPYCAFTAAGTTLITYTVAVEDDGARTSEVRCARLPTAALAEATV